MNPDKGDMNSTLFCFFFWIRPKKYGLWNKIRRKSHLFTHHGSLHQWALCTAFFFYIGTYKFSIVCENLTFLLAILSDLGIGGTVTLISLVIKDYVGEDVFSKLHPMTPFDISLMATNSQHVPLGSTRMLRNQCPLHYCWILVSN